jgi:hypothetical protein
VTKAAASQRQAAEGSLLYETDFFAWTQRTAALLRAGRFDVADVEHAATEIEDMGRRDLKELNSRMQVLLMHLLKWQLQPDKRSPSWETTIVTQRIEIAALLQQSPSLRMRLQSELAGNYVGAVKRAWPETALSTDQFPLACPYTVEQIVDEQFLPD